MINRKKKWYLIGFLAVLGSAVVFLALRPDSSGGDDNGFELAELKRGDLEILVDSTGTLSALETVEIGSQVSGRIEKLFVDFNSEVKKGQILAQIEKLPFEMSVQDAQASLLSTKAKMNQAEAEHRRNQTLFDKGHVSETEYLATKTSYETSKAAHNQAEAALNKARINLGYTVIRSPIDGTVIERSIDEGQTIAASFSAPTLFIIAQDLKQMQIEAQVDESDIGQIQEGQNTRFTVQAFPDRIFTGVVRQIRLQPQTIQNVVNYTVVVDAKNDDGLLLPGMTATVDFIVEDKKGVLLVPNSALSFTPPEELLSRQEKSPRPALSGKSPKAGQMPENLRDRQPEDMGRVFYIADDKSIRMGMFRKGSSDGKMTELAGSRDLKEGMMIITGKGSAARKTSQRQNGGFFGPRPGGPGPR